MDLEATVNTDLQAARPLSHPPEPGDHRTTLREIVCEEVCGGCQERHLSGLRSIVLTGSLARDEATFFKEEGRWKLLGDAEFLLIFEENRALPPTTAIALLREEIEKGLSRHQLCAHIVLSPVSPKYLRKLCPHIFAYELRNCGQVVWGDQEILSLIPDFPASHIPLEDAWRMLCNRIVEQLEVADELSLAMTRLSPSVTYKTVKLYLDMATSLLVFAGAYQPTYRARAEQLRILADSTRAHHFPFPLRAFSERVSASTKFKLQESARHNESTTGKEIGAGLVFWKEAVGYAQLLWRWELARLAGLQGQVPDRELLENWMKLQPAGKKLRGWLYVLRTQGWYRSWRDWPYWIRLGLRASPRYWIYGAASKLFFHLPEVLDLSAQHSQADLDWEELHTWLPVRNLSLQRRGLLTWRHLASEITWNYYKFLMGTRA